MCFHQTYKILIARNVAPESTLQAAFAYPTKYTVALLLCTIILVVCMEMGVVLEEWTYIAESLFEL